MAWDSTIVQDINFPIVPIATMWVKFDLYSELSIKVDNEEVYYLHYSKIEPNVWTEIEFLITSGEYILKINGSNSGYIWIDELELKKISKEEKNEHYTTG